MAQNMKISVTREAGENVIINVKENETFQEFQARILKEYNICLTKEQFSSAYINLSSTDNFFNHLKETCNNKYDKTSKGSSAYEVNMAEQASSNMGAIVKLENSSPYIINEESLEITPNVSYTMYTSNLNNTLIDIHQGSNTNGTEYTTVLNENLFTSENYEIIPKENSTKKSDTSQRITLFGDNNQYELIKSNCSSKDTENKEKSKTPETNDEKILENELVKPGDNSEQNYSYMDIESKLREIHSYNEECVTDFCRLCAVNIAENNKMLIYKDNEDGEMVADKILQTLPISISKDDGLPQQVCQMCFERTTKLYDFIQMVMQADKILRLKFTSGNHNGGKLKDSCVSDFMSEFLQSALEKPPPKTETNKNFKPEPNETDNYETEYLELEYDDNKPDANISKCRLCDLVIDNVTDAICHSSKMHNIKGIIACCFCEYGYQSIEELSSHVESYHKKQFELENIRRSRKYQCSVCSKKYISQSQFEKHTCIKNILNKTLHCEICNQEFPTKVRLNFHRQFHLKDSRPLYCSLCNITFETENEYFDHVNFIHDSKQVYSCEYCDKTFSIRAALNNHKKSHTGVRNYKCEDCDKSFLDKQTLKEHQVCHLETKPYQCHICGKNLNRSSRLRKHLLTHESNPVVNDVHICSLCKEAFANEQAAQLHEGCHQDNKLCIEILSTDKVFRCEFCEKCFSSTSALNNHRATHVGPVPYTCHICKAQFSSYSRCTTHKTTHGLYKDGAEKDNFPVVKHFLCEHCGKSYLHWTYLGLHRRLKHSDNIHMYKCEKCNLEFPTSWAIAYHRKTKHNPVQYKCPDCGKQLSNHHSLKLHRISQHPDKASDLHCVKCGKIFSNVATLQAHLKTHEAVKEFKCSVCSKKFLNSAGLSQHMKLHKTKYLLYKEMVHEVQNRNKIDVHCDRPYTCDICGLSFRRQYLLRNHKLKHNYNSEENSFVLMVDMKEDAFENNAENLQAQTGTTELVPEALTETEEASNNIQMEMNTDETLANYINLGNGNYLQIQGNTFNIDGKQYILIDENGRALDRDQIEMVMDDNAQNETEREVATENAQNNETIMLVEPNDSYEVDLNVPQPEFLFTASDTVLPKTSTTYVIGNQFMLENDPNLV